MTPDRDWEEVLDVNAGGAFRCCRAVLPGMIRRRRGSIVNVSSLAAVEGVAGQTAYAASKAALLGLTRALAREVGPRGIRVNAVLPGFVRDRHDRGAARRRRARAAIPRVPSQRHLRRRRRAGGRPSCCRTAPPRSPVSRSWSTPAPRHDRAATGAAPPPAAPPQAPALGSSYRLLGRFHVAGVFWYRFPHWGFARLPAWTDRSRCRHLHRVVLDRAAPHPRGDRRRTSSRSSVPPESAGAVAPRAAHDVLLRLVPGRALSLSARPPSASRPRSKARRTGASAIATGRGAVVVTAHIGPWENAVQFGASDAQAAHPRRAREGARSARPGVRARDRVAHRRRLHHPLRRRRSGAGPRAGQGAARRTTSWRCRGIGRAPAASRTEVAACSAVRCELPIGPAALARAADGSDRAGLQLPRGPLPPAIRGAPGHPRRPHRRSRLGPRGAPSSGSAPDIEWAIRRAPTSGSVFAGSGARGAFVGAASASSARARRGVLQIEQRAGTVRSSSSSTSTSLAAPFRSRSRRITRRA